MNRDELLRAFAERFIRESFRERFLHEISKKPMKLHERLCHSMADLFLAEFKDQSATYSLRDPCLVFTGSSTLQQTTWQDAQRVMKQGDGVLIIDGGNRTFYAETETMAGYPFEAYGGG
ncbi:MAG: hypothetical protein ACR2IE_06665 [Candidatus Sumerlaeaceae bacterium]